MASRPAGPRALAARRTVGLPPLSWSSVERRLRVAAAARSTSGGAAVAEIIRGIAAVDFAGTVAPGSISTGLSHDVVLYALEVGESPEAIAAPSQIPVLFLYPGDPSGLRLSAPGASGVPPREELSFMPMRCSREELAAALTAVAVGLTVRHPDFALDGRVRASSGGGRGAEDSFHGDLGSKASGGLTGREREVLVMIAEGLPNKTIAAELGITSHTVKFHIASIMQKLGAASRTEAVTVGLRKGIIFL